MTEWVSQDPEGQKLWIRTTEDLNIGDLATVEMDRLAPYLRRHGILELHVLYCGGVTGRGFSFDTVLVQPASA